MANRDGSPFVDTAEVKAATAELSWSDTSDAQRSARATPPTANTPPASGLDEFECPLCSRRFADESALEEHAKSHPGETDYVCPAENCGKRFSTTGNLARHRRRHGYLPPIQCPAPKCKYSTDAAHKLARHMKIHRETSTRVCTYPGCGKEFATTGNLNRHFRTQHLQPQGPRPGRPRGSSTARPDAAETLLRLSANAVELSPRVVGGAPFDAAAAGAIAADEEVELLETLSLFLDPDSPRHNGASTPRESHEDHECSPILDELARFHASHSSDGAWG